MTHNSFKVLTDNQVLKHFKTTQKLFFKQCHYFNLILDFNFHIKYCSEKANIKTDAFTRMLNCIPDNENERIQKHYQVLLSSEQFQIAVLKREESTQQSTLSKHNFYKQIKEVNQIDRKLKQIKKKCVKQSEKWYDTVSKKTMIQNSIFYKNHYLWVSENIITEFFQLTHNESFNDHQRQNQTRN